MATYPHEPNNTTAQPSSSAADRAALTLMPLPAKLSFEEGHLTIDRTFSVALTGYVEPRLEAAAQRLVERLSAQTGIPMPVRLTDAAERAALTLHCDSAADEVQAVVEDESYALTGAPDGAQISAPKPYGVLRGIETFLQLVKAGEAGFVVPAVRIEDQPRFPWRGLMIDVCRHWIPLDIIKRNLDAMAAVKLNVLHLHLTEDQGFRIESKRFPKLHELGSDGDYFTQDEIHEIVIYARNRGIRVVPEFDIPGHTTAWFVGHPELASAPGPYEIERTWGIKDPTMDPTREEVYEFLDRFLDEMVTLFPDPYVHIGGDEVSGVHWTENPQIQAFIEENELGDNHGLQAYFNQRVQAILQEKGKSIIGWDEVFHPDMPKDIVVHSWRGQASLFEAAQQGYQGVLSHGYYLDHNQPASFHYGFDPVPAAAGEEAIMESAPTLTPEQQSRILGGEACMWTELVSAEVIDSRMWPRLAAIAERLWSPAKLTQDVDDMYRRLSVTSDWLSWTGIRHQANYRLMLQRMTVEDIESLRRLAEVLEPVKAYQRHGSRTYTQFTPHNRLVDAVPAESDRARVFSQMVDALIDDPKHKANRETIEAWLTSWRGNHAKLQAILEASFLLQAIEPLSRNLSDVAALGLEVLEALQTGGTFTEAQRQRHLALLDRAAKSQDELLLQIVPAVRKLVEAAMVT